MTTAAPSSPDPGAVANFEKSTELDKALRAVLKKKGFYDPEARSLRASLRDCYEAIVLTDLDFATFKDVEQHLWWNVFYRPIEEFRSKHRKAAEKGADQEAVQKLTSSYLKFLEEAKAYYRRLVVALQRTYGDVGVWDATENVEQSKQDAERMRGRPSAKRDCRLSVHRCLICLGDLFRYHASLVRTSKAEWRAASQHYRLAARVYPSSGNPFNQLAVMAYYTNDELRAVYYYFRSLAVKTPFTTARENLLMLFERSRAKLKQQHQQHGNAAPGEALGHDPRKSAVQNAVQETASTFVRLHGLLYDKINMEQFEDLKHKAVVQLDALLANRDALDAIAGQPAHDQMFLHLAVLSVFSICSHDHRPEEQAGAQPPYAEIVQRAALKRSALCTMFGMGAGVLRAAAALPPGDAALGSLLVAVHVLLRWLGMRPDVAAGHKNVDAKEATARVAFWRAAAALLRKLPNHPLQESDSRVCLPEELDLQGFEPLGWECAGPEDIRAKPEDNSNARAARIQHLCTTIAKALSSPHAAVAPGQLQGMFGISAGEEQALKDSVDQFCAAVRAANPAAALPPPPAAQVQAAPAPAAPAAPAAAPAAAAADDAADDEVIVFRPQSASRPGSSVGDEAAPGPLTRPTSSNSLQAAGQEEPKVLPFSLFDDKAHFNFGLHNVLPGAEQRAHHDEVDAALGLVARNVQPPLPTRPSTTPAQNTTAQPPGSSAAGPGSSGQGEDHSLLGLFTQRRVATAPPQAQAYRPATGPAYPSGPSPVAPPPAAAAAGTHYAGPGTSAPMPNELPSPAVLKPRTSPPAAAGVNLYPGATQQSIHQPQAQPRTAANPITGLFLDNPAFARAAHTPPADTAPHANMNTAGSAFATPTAMDYQPFGGMPPPSYDFRQLAPAAAAPHLPVPQLLPRSASAGNVVNVPLATAAQQSILSISSVPTPTLAQPGQLQLRVPSGDLMPPGFQTGSSHGHGMRDSSGSWAHPTATAMMEAGEPVENDPELRELQLLGQQAAFMVVGDEDAAADVGTMWRPPSITAGMGLVGLRGSSTGPATPTSSFTLFSGRSSPFPDLAAQANAAGWNAGAAVPQSAAAAQHVQQGLPVHLLEERMLRQAASFPPHGAAGPSSMFQAGSAAHAAAAAAAAAGGGVYPTGMHLTQGGGTGHHTGDAAQAAIAALQGGNPIAAHMGVGHGAGTPGLPLLQARHSAGSTLQSLFGGNQQQLAGAYAQDMGNNAFAQLGFGGGAAGGPAAELMPMQGMTVPMMRPTKNVYGRTANPFVP